MTNATAPATSTATAKPKAKRASVPKDETPRQRFERVAGGRLGAVVENLTNVGKIKGKTYQFTQADIDKMRAGVTQVLNDTCLKLAAALAEPKSQNGEAKKRAKFVFN